MTPPPRDLWRSLEERAGLADGPEAAPAPGVDRRRFLQLMGASIALAGTGGCFRQPAETVVPHVRRPENRVPGKSLWFATAMPHRGFGTGLLVESHDGRPTKVEGNQMHPASLGATDVVQQASLLGLYDPDRSQVVTNRGTIRPWGAFLTAARAALEGQRESRGAGLRILTETVTSPSLAAAIRALLEEFPRARWIAWEPAGRDAYRAGTRRALGEDVDTRLRLDRAAVVLSLDADLFSVGPARVRYARDFARGRRALGAGETMNRLWVVESMPTVTGQSADRRVALRSRDVQAFARAVAAGLGVRLASAGDAEAVRGVSDTVRAVVRDLDANRGRSIVVAGDHQPPSTHALAHALNHALANVGRTVEYSDPVEEEPAVQGDTLRALADEMEARAVEMLLILGGNPVLTAPADLRFGERLERVPFRVHLGLHEDETAARCTWHVPEAHYLESWGDVRAFDGTASIVQPLIAPLYGGRTALELLAALTGDDRSGHDLVRAHWQRRIPAGVAFDKVWRQALHDGVMPGTAESARRVRLRDDWDAGPPPPAPAEGLEVVLRPDPYLDDGRFANNAWLQELPRPVTKLVWDNAALLAPATASRLGVASSDVVELTAGERTIALPVWVLPGHAADSVTVHLGWGRERGGAVARGAGVDAFPLQTTGAPALLTGVTLRPTGTRRRLVTTQAHHRMEGRDIVRAATLAEYHAHPDLAHGDAHGSAGEPPTLYPREAPPNVYPGHAWAMTIDLTTCIGCQACVMACVAENNIPVVGRDQVARGREMHWIRVDRYFEGDENDPAILYQPVPCMHCEHAPCEVVCPVNATVHSSEGLNDMVYNRCVGTRYCSNNCPYKVRRFNFFQYSNWDVEVLKMAANPDVTVRSRGVMEKCTYCVQRIEEARARAIVEGRPLRDGDVVTACAQACPTEAIVFGDMNDPESRVAKTKADERNYALLGELGTRPRTTYLARVRNPGGETRG